MDRLTKAQMEFMNGYVPANIHDVYEYAAGGGIHIKDSKKGTFTAAATKHGKSVQAFASQVLANKDNYSPAMVKKANFAKNASKWNHQEGGTATGQNDQVMQMIQTYAQMVAQQSGDDPNKVYQELMGQLQQMKPDQQKQAIQEIVSQVQGASQQPTMQMGGDPSQMQQQSGDAEQLIQQIQQMLEQGAEPQEVIAQLLQSQIDPQMVVEIFVQLGMPQEQVVQAVQSVMQEMGSGQEQEVPQEQMQEQGMEEPMQESMAYGGIAKYPYGGMYADKKYYGDFLPQDAFNNAMTDINMLAVPAATMAASGVKALRPVAGIMGAAGALAGSIQGYRGLFNKDATATPKNPITNAQATYVYDTYGKPNTDPWASKMMDKYMNPNKDPWATKMQKKYMQDGGTPNNPGFNALPDYVQEKIIANIEYSGLPQAQFGIPGSFDFNNPFGMQSPRFGQTADYADTVGYPQNKSRIDYNKLNNFSIGPGINDNASLSYGDPYAADGVNRQVPKQTAMTPVSTYGTGVTPYTKTNAPKTNDKVARNVSGRQMANNALLGLSISNYALGKSGPRPKSVRQTNQQREANMLSNPLNYLGVNTTNVQGGGNQYLPNRYDDVDDYGTTGNVIAKTGGQMNFAAGGQYKVSHDQLLQLLRDGAEIEFL
jgi:hypothetical protein